MIALAVDRRRQAQALLDHRVDAAVTRLPLRTDGLHVTILYDEPRVLLVPLDHRLAGKESVTLDDIADEPIAAGQAVAIIPGAIPASAIRPDLTTIPLHGVEPSHVVLATRSGDRSRLVAAFRKSAQDTLTGLPEA